MPGPMNGGLADFRMFTVLVRNEAASAPIGPRLERGVLAEPAAGVDYVACSLQGVELAWVRH